MLSLSRVECVTSSGRVSPNIYRVSHTQARVYIDDRLMFCCLCVLVLVTKLNFFLFMLRLGFVHWRRRAGFLRRKISGNKKKKKLLANVAVCIYTSSSQTPAWLPSGVSISLRLQKWKSYLINKAPRLYSWSFNSQFGKKELNLARVFTRRWAREWRDRKATPKRCWI